MIKKTLLFCLLLTSDFLYLHSQTYNIPLNNDVYNRFEPQLNAPGVDFHTSFKPYRFDQVNKIANQDSIINTMYAGNSLLKRDTRFYKKLRRDHLIHLNRPEFTLFIDPLMNFQFGKDVANHTNAAVNTRGMMFGGTIGNNFSFVTTFYENQATFVNYLDRFVKKDSVVPGQGMVKFNEQGLNRYDYSNSTGYISYSPSTHFNFQLGQDKNFIGDGYRSLLLSDNAYSYPFFKITTNIWKIQYVNLYAQFTDMKANHTYTQGFQKKFGSFHYLTIDIGKRLNIGLFESVIWQAQDSAGYRGYELSYLNPIIFFRPVEFSLGSPDNEMLGLNVKYKLGKKTVLYSQVMVDEFLLANVLGRQGKGWSNNKQGVQLGFKTFNLFGLKDLNLQSEVNYVRPFSYTHYIELSNYGHANQTLADPLNSNFLESVSFLRYRYKSFYFENEFLYALHGQDPAGLNYGNDIYLSYLTAARSYGNYVGQGVRTLLLYNNLRAGYIINPRYNLQLELGMTYRSQKTETSTELTNFIYLGLRTNLSNAYYDF